MENNKFAVNEEQLNAVSGGGTGAFQLYYNGSPIPMDVTVETLCGMPEYAILKGKLGALYFIVKGMTANQLCAQYGQETIQSLIDSNG